MRVFRSGPGNPALPTFSIVAGTASPPPPPPLALGPEQATRVAAQPAQSVHAGASAPSRPGAAADPETDPGPDPGAGADAAAAGGRTVIADVRSLDEYKGAATSTSS